ncbi:MAG: PH domain-containing protein [Bradymonadaceae bacterium]|nr:PH domain-containing protein [Lujinxingiaceae bacterium]
MNADLTIKPQFKPFVIRPTLQLAAALMVLLGTGFAIGVIVDAPPILGVGLAFLFVVLVGLKLGARVVRFQKTTYSFYPERVILHTGGLIGERSVDLQLKNITQIGATLPFIENRLYKSGNVTIQAAGSAGAEITMESVADPMFFYDELAKRMRANGFSIKRTQEIQRERPGLVGTSLEMGEKAVWALFSLAILLAQFSVAVANVLSDDKIASDSLGFYAFLATTGFVALLGVAWSALHFIDLLQRTYILYDDVIDYHDGFMTQRHRFIPIENLADVTLSQSLPRRMLNIADLVVSCQGADTNIKFKVMPRAEQFKANLERLIRARAPRPMASTNAGLDVLGAPDDHGVAVAPVRRPTLNRPELELRISLARAIGGTLISHGIFVAAAIALGAVAISIVVGLDIDGIEEVVAASGIATLVLLVVVAAVVVRVGVTHGVNHYATRYRIDDHKLGLHFSLFNKRQVEFTLDKVTAVSVSHGIFDRLFKTASLTFNSIGSSETVVFEHVPNGRATAAEILERIGLSGGQAQSVLRSDFSMGQFVRARALSVAVWTTLIAINVVVAIFAPMFWLLVAFFVFAMVLRFAHHVVFYQRCRLDLFADRLHLRQGIFTIHHHHAALHHIKHLQSMRYIGSETGRLSWVVGGGAGAGLDYLSRVDMLHERLDATLYAHPIKPVRQPSEFDTTTLRTAQRAVSNALVRLVVTSFILLPLVALLPFTVALSVARARRTRYVAQSRRVVATWGLIYRSRKTILYNRIDHLTTSRGLLNKMFGNGNVGVATVGSNVTDMVLAEIKDHQGFYSIVEEHLPKDL